MSSVLTIFSGEQPILLIDDCPMYRTAAKGMLLKLGFSSDQLHLVSDAKSALDLCRQKKFQLVLCDYNLGAKTNGHQLLDQLIHDRMLPADCVIIVVTGDASSAVVRGFAELEPDGYLVKPLNFNTLRSRLPKLGRRKRMLGKMLHSFAGGDYTQMLDQADEALCSASEMAHSAQLLKARALIQLGQLDAARNLLITLNPGPEPTRVILELATVAKLQKHYKTSQILLDQIKTDPIYCGDVLQISAELDLLQGQFESAFEKISEAVTKSPKHIGRHQLKTHIAMANFDLQTALQSANCTVRQVRHSFRETAEIHQLAAQLSLDCAHLSKSSEQYKLLNQFAAQCKEWRLSFPREQYKAMDLLLIARAHSIKGNISQARLSLAEYKTWVQENENHTVSALEKLECAKSALLLNDTDNYEQLMNDLSNQLNQQQTDQTLIALGRYVACWRAEYEQRMQQANHLKKSARGLIKEESFEQASNILVAALPLNSSDEEIPLLLLNCLTKAWPHGCSKKEVQDLVLRCRDLLLNTSAIYSANYQRHSHILASQLQINELLALRHENAAV